jgi:hypothetical protein
MMQTATPKLAGAEPLLDVVNWYGESCSTAAYLELRLDHGDWRCSSTKSRR